MEKNRSNIAIFVPTKSNEFLTKFVSDLDKIDLNKIYCNNDLVYLNKLRSFFSDFDIHILKEQTDRFNILFTGDRPSLDNDIKDSWFSYLIPSYFKVVIGHTNYQFDQQPVSNNGFICDYGYKLQAEIKLMEGWNCKGLSISSCNGFLERKTIWDIIYQLRTMLKDRINKVYQLKKAIDDRIKELEEKQDKN